MEKYLVIIVIILIAYYSITCLKSKEGFADTTTTDVDLSNSINTLAQIAADLQAGKGLKVMGALRVTGAKSTPAGSGDMLTHFNHEDGNNYIRGNTFLAGNLGVGNIYTSANCNNVNKINLESSGVNSIGSDACWTTFKHHTNEGWKFVDQNKAPKFQISSGSGDARLWSQNYVIGKDNNRHIFHTPDDERKGLWIVPAKDNAASEWLWGNGLNIKRDGNTYLGYNVTIPGNLILSNSIYRKHGIAGYYQIRAYGYKVPIYYGFNMFWPDHNVKEGVRRKWGWPEFMFNNPGIDMRNSGDNDQNWTPRYLTVFPGYKVKIYAWDGSFAQREGVYQAGEYPFNDTNYRVHGIYVALQEEGDPPNRIDW